jgi:subtilisin family serine protease
VSYADAHEESLTLTGGDGGRSRGRRRATLVIASVAAIAAAMVIPGAAAAKPTRAEVNTLYLIQLAGDPLATYTGTVAGIPATKPAEGAKLDTRSWNYKAYRSHLQAKRTEALRAAGIDASQKVADYGVTFNGFAASLTSAEVAKLRATPGVVNIFKNRILKSQTVRTPTFLGLAGSGGVWNRQFGGQEHAGEGMIIGVIDSGFWPENPSFAAMSEPRPDADAIAAKWNGECVAGDEEPVFCTNKVIGARWYNRGGAGNVFPGEYFSPRDRNGHGSHTASTAAGVPTNASVAGSPLGQVSGMAPAARLSIYKALWHQPSGTASGSGIDIISAIDDAVADGVDVINYSIGDDQDEVQAEDVAFLNAAAAGVFIAAAAGNAGPGAGTVDNAFPWQTTVGAGTHDVKYAKSAMLGNGTSFEGVGVGPAVPTAPLIDSATAAPPGGNVTQATLCFIGALDPVKVAGKIVLCQRGTNNRVDKSEAVKQAGGVGMILFNPAPNSLNAETHSVPTVHVGPPEGAAIKAYIAGTASPTAALTATTLKPQRAPGVTPFSSVGPSQSSGGDLLKPDILAPGVDVAAAVAPVSNPANSFHDLKSGTSMASPHIAGIATLLKSKNPAWTPSMVKSAMMTTAYQIDNTGQPIARVDLGVNATPLEYGAGHVRPPSAFDPGLLYDSGPLEWIQYTCGIGVELLLGDGSSVCDITGAIDPSNLNYASIAIGDMTGKQTITRTVTNATNQASVYFAKVEAPPGVSVKVTPTVLTVLPRRTATYTVEFTRTSAAFDQYTFGALTWADLRGHSVRSPIAIQPVALAAPPSVVGTGTSGSRPLQVAAGYSGVLATAPFGLVAPTTQTRHLVGVDTDFDPDLPAAGPAVAKVDVTAPANSKAVRFATFGTDYPAGTDIDLFVYEGGQLVGVSAGGSAEEEVTLPAGGTFEVYVVQFALAPGVSEQDVHLRTYALPPASAGNMTVTPASRSVTVGQQVTFTLNWSGLAAGTRYFGAVQYSDSTAPRGLTLVTIST